MGQWDWLLSSLISLLCMHLTGSLHGGKSDQLNQRAIESKAIGGSQLYNRERGKGESDGASGESSQLQKKTHMR